MRLSAFIPKFAITILEPKTWLVRVTGQRVPVLATLAVLALALSKSETKLRMTLFVASAFLALVALAHIRTTSLVRTLWLMIRRVDPE